MSLVDIHPNTLKFIPSLATHWAFGADGKTVYYKLDPRARWSDGEPVTADDYVFSREMRLSDFIVDPFGKNYFTDQIVDVVKHDDYTISVVGCVPEAARRDAVRVRPEPRAAALPQARRRLGNELRLAARADVPGAYHTARVEKGRFIELERTANWWAGQLKYYQHRFNVDKIRVEVIRDDDVALQYFLRGELDAYSLATPARWYEKAVGEPFDKGYIHKIQFYNDVPREARGMWLNMDVPLLNDKNIRLGIAYAMNWDAVLRTVMRGDYPRLRMHFEGYYWGYSNPTIQPRGFDLAKADQYFTTAGFTQRGPGRNPHQGWPAPRRQRELREPRSVLPARAAPRRGQEGRPRAEPQFARSIHVGNAGRREEARDRDVDVRHRPHADVLATLSLRQRAQAADEQHHQHG